jgi:hypothetical protein
MALVVLLMAVIWGWMVWRAGADPAPPVGASKQQGVDASRRPVAASTQPARPVVAARASTGSASAAPSVDSNDLAAHVPPGEAPSMATVIQRLNQAGIYTGLGAFNPPGTSPPLVGLAVPPDFPLPEGYVRHHQTTDDGQDIEPILMFAADRPLFDANNRPIPIPPNRVVPAEWAPPGLPVRKIVVPPPLAPGSGAS